MYNVADLPAVREQAAKTKSVEVAANAAESPPNAALHEARAQIHSKPHLALDNGRYYVVDSKR
jgi:hypothetical protein